MGSLSLVVCSLALWLGTAVGDHVNIYPPPAPQDLFIQGVHQQLPDCAPELNEITQYSTVTTTRDVFTTQVVPEVLQRTLYKTNYVTETSNTVETVYTTILIRSNIRVVETSTKYATAYTAVPTTFTETSTRTQYDIRAGQATAIITSTVTEVDEQFVPVYVTQTVYGVNPVTQTTTSTITSRQYVAVTVSFTERTTVPVVITETQTLPVPAVTSTVVNYITQVVPFTQTVPSERVISHREIHTSTVTSFAQGLFPVTVTQTLCPLGGSVLDVVQTGPAVDVQLLLPGPSLHLVHNLLPLAAFSVRD
ncbi:unnamed protein product [Meganyctiphanes norvegica]|uniref:Uncharacterized protein n=1 Tax=Meganyctiphanes norvegica TaxID=48144 RepID=A0AAV2S996_MEGNR